MIFALLCRVMDGIVRSPRLAAIVLLLLCALPCQLDAQQFVCSAIAPGEGASSVARRLTGKAAAAYDHAFQIRDPARRMFVPKSQYQRLQSDWQACVASGPVRSAPAASAPAVELAPVAEAPAVTSMPLALVTQPLTLAHADRTPFAVPVAPTIGGGVLLIILVVAGAGSLARRSIPPSIRRIGEDFVTVFARPLMDASSAMPPIQTRLRFLRRKHQLEIFLAPGPGHRYPNLSDHKRNVEYDVDRVIRVLGNYALSHPPRAAGKWVVVTIRPVDGQHQGV